MWECVRCNVNSESLIVFIHVVRYLFALSLYIICMLRRTGGSPQLFGVRPHHYITQRRASHSGIETGRWKKRK